MKGSENMKTIRTGVVKIGGARGNDPRPLLKDLAERSGKGEKWLLVHGASSYMEDICIASGLEPLYVTSPSGFRSRYVGERERDLFEFACTRFSVDLVSVAAELGLWALPLYPPYFPSASGKRKDVLRSVENGRTRILRGNYSGTVRSFDPKWVGEAWAMGSLPLLPPIALSPEDGISLNVDGDRLAAAAANALEADVLVILSNVPGLLSDPSDITSLIPQADLSRWEGLEKCAEGNMKRKLLAAKEALEKKVEKVIIADSREENPLSRALSGGGTMLCQKYMDQENLK